MSEGFLEGYVIMDVNTENKTFDQLPAAQQRAMLERFVQVGEPSDGHFIQKARALCRELKIYLQFGFLHRVEKNSSAGGTALYNAVGLFDPDGDLINLCESQALWQPMCLQPKAGTTNESATCRC